MLALLLGLAVGLAAAPAVRWLRRKAAVNPDDPSLQEPMVTTQLEAAVDLLRAAAFVAGPYDEVLHSNPQARTLGLVRGNRISLDGLLEDVRGVRQTQRPRATSLTVRREPGTPPLELAVRMTAVGNGMVLVIADDRSAQLRADEIKRDFVANVSHELKTPVGAIRVLAEAVEQAADDPEAVARFSSRMIVESERLSELVQQIIELSRLQSEDPLTQSEVVELDDVAAAAVGYCRELANSRSVVLTLTGTDVLRVVGDADQLTSAVVNLIQNAINYSDTGARVAVSTRQVEESGDRFVEISVADNGIGIRQEELERIFERFYRVDYARSRSQGGTGLGLSIVKHTVAAHGGTVNVWSKVGQGSTFTLRLPAYEEAPSVEPTPTASLTQPGGMP